MIEDDRNEIIIEVNWSFQSIVNLTNRTGMEWNGIEICSLYDLRGSRRIGSLTRSPILCFFAKLNNFSEIFPRISAYNFIGFPSMLLILANLYGCSFDSFSF